MRRTLSGWKEGGEGDVQVHASPTQSLLCRKYHQHIAQQSRALIIWPRLGRRPLFPGQAPAKLPGGEDSHTAFFPIAPLTCLLAFPLGFRPMRHTPLAATPRMTQPTGGACNSHTTPQLPHTTTKQAHIDHTPHACAPANLRPEAWEPILLRFGSLATCTCWWLADPALTLPYSPGQPGPRRVPPYCVRAPGRRAVSSHVVLNSEAARPVQSLAASTTTTYLRTRYFRMRYTRVRSSYQQHHHTQHLPTHPSGRCSGFLLPCNPHVCSPAPWQTSMSCPTLFLCLADPLLDPWRVGSCSDGTPRACTA